MAAHDSDVSHVRVRQGLLQRLESRRGGAESAGLVTAQSEEHNSLLADVKAPVSWLDRLDGKRTTPPLAVSTSHDVCADRMATASWLAKVRAENRFHEVSRRATEHRCPSARSRHNDLRRARAPQELQAHCRASVEFLRGPRQLRDRFGSVLDGTDQTADVVFAQTVDLRSAMMSDVADLCRRVRETRFEELDHSPRSDRSPDSDSETLVQTRVAADAALEESERVLARSGFQDEATGPADMQSSRRAALLERSSRARIEQLLAGARHDSDGESTPPSPGVRERAEEALQESDRLLAVFNARKKAQESRKT